MTLPPLESALATTGHDSIAETLAGNDMLAPALAQGYPLDPAAMAQKRAGGLIDKPDFRREEISTRQVGGIDCRVIEVDQPIGTYLHLHGGGWSFGSHLSQDERLWQLATETGLRVISVGYRLAPEHPAPAAEEDALAVARTLLDDALPPRRLAIGGESAGAHLSAATALALRDAGVTGLAGLVLTYGLFDLTGTPSWRRAEAVKRRGWAPGEVAATDCYCQGMDQTTRRARSPLYADLTGMPPARFLVGTRDGLLDDTLWMADRWRQVAPTEVEVVAGADHAFTLLEELAVTRQARAAEHEFLRRVVAADLTG